MSRRGARRRVLPARARRRRSRSPASDVNFSRDGKGLFLATDRDGEFRKLACLDLASGTLDYFGDGGNWDVESIALSPDGRTLAVVTNEAGIGVLRLYDAATRKPLPRPALPIGSVRGLVWHENSRDLAVSVNSAQSPSDVYAIDVRDQRRHALDRDDACAGLDASAFRSAAADRMEELRRPRRSPASSSARRRSFTGKRPVHHRHPRRARRPGAAGLHRPLQLLRRRARRRDHLAERARLDRLRQDLPRARQRHEARGLGARTSARCSTGSRTQPDLDASARDRRPAAATAAT